MSTIEKVLFRRCGWKLVAWNHWHWRITRIRSFLPGQEMRVWMLGPFVLSKQEPYDADT